MLRTLGRNGFVERSIVAHRHNNTSGRYGPAALRLTTATFTHSRLLSTSTPQIKSDPSTSKTPAPIPPETNVSTPRKSKVDLKPAPVKPSISKATLLEPVVISQAARNSQVHDSKLRPPAESATHHTSTSKSSTTPLSPFSAITASVIEAQRDIKGAIEHGVFVPPPAGAGWARKLLHQAKELAKFYWNGLKMINTHRLQVAQIKLRVKEGGEPISRAEYRFMRTYEQDSLKIVPFILVAITLEELIPLIAIYAPGMLPSTTVLPLQRKRIEEKAKEKQTAFAARQAAFARIAQLGKERGKEGIAPTVDLQSLRALGGDCTKAICGVLRLATWGPEPMLLVRIDRHLNHIARDDELLAKEDMARLNGEEVGKALDERGIIATKRGNDHGRRQLKAWLTATSFGLNDGSKVARRIYVVAEANV